MSWILEGAPGTDRVFEYEAMMNQFYPTSRAVGLCLYDRRLLDPATLGRALHTHPFVGMSGEIFNNPDFDPANQMRAVSFDSATLEGALESVRRTAAASARIGRDQV
jgi:two-component system, sensor histidine kinase PdtaS